MMPENYYCADNFFKKMTSLESPRRNNDCYFYYYSTCTKGDSCMFRHEPSALGCETVCAFWKEGKCLNVHCNLRHMELRKNRKTIQCYWESQPGGCLKPHCPFMHQMASVGDVSYAPQNTPNQPFCPANQTYTLPDVAADCPTTNSSVETAATGAAAATQQSSLLTTAAHNDSGTASADNSVNQTAYTGTTDNNKVRNLYSQPPVESLVVKFEEESDNEGGSGTIDYPMTDEHSRYGLTTSTVGVKTLEEIRLERVQAETAAFYGGAGGTQQTAPLFTAGGVMVGEATKPLHNLNGDLRGKLAANRSQSQQHSNGSTTAGNSNKRRSVTTLCSGGNRQKKSRIEHAIQFGYRPNNIEVKRIHIKTLEEIRMERSPIIDMVKDDNHRTKDNLTISRTEESVVPEETDTDFVEKSAVKKVIKLRRSPPPTSPKEKKQPFSEVCKLSKITTSSRGVQSVKIVDQNSSNIVDDEAVLLLQDDDENCNVTLKDEEALLNDDDDEL